MSKKNCAEREQPTLPARYGRPDPEINDGVPVEMPLTSCKPEPLESMIARMVQSHVAQEQGNDPESYEESDDFDMEDEDLLLDFSKYELQDLAEDFEPGDPQADSPPPEQPFKEQPDPDPAPDPVVPSEDAGTA